LARISRWPGPPIRITTTRPEFEPTSMTARDRSATQDVLPGKEEAALARSIGEAARRRELEPVYLGRDFECVLVRALDVDA